MKKLLNLMFILAISAVLGLCSQAATYEDAMKVAYDPPFSAVLPDGTRLSVVEGRGQYLCLPGNVELSQISYVYTGSEQMYLPSTDKFVGKGETFTVDVTVGKNAFYEYIASSDTYYMYEVNVLQGSQIPSMYIEFDDSYSFNVLNYLSKSKENSVTGSLYMTDADGEVMYDGTLDNMRCRGNSSFGSPGLQGDKRSFNIKLTDKAELIDGAGDMCKYALLHMRVDTAYDYDVTGLGSILGLRTYEALCDEGYYTNKIRPVDVYIEGMYRGVYLLVERLDVNAAVDITDSDKYVTGEFTEFAFVTSASDPAIQKGIQQYSYCEGITAAEGLDLTGGYLLEVNVGRDRCSFTTSHNVTIQVKAPELCTKEQMQYIASYVQEFEDALYSPTGYNSLGKHYSDYMDLKSMADGVLTYAFYQNWELMRTSTYLYKDVDGSDREKLTFGPVWDFETGAKTHIEDETLFGEHNFYETYRQYVWIEQLWSRADFMALATERALALSQYMHDMLDGEDALINGILDEQMDSMSMNWVRWGLDRSLRSSGKFRDVEHNYEAMAQYHADAFRTRLEHWDGLWSDAYLLGAKVTNEYDGKSGEYTFTAVPVGTAETCQWYSVDEAGEMEMISGADGFEFVTDEEGTYVCMLSGDNNAFYARGGAVFSERSITMSVASTAAENSVDSDGGIVLIVVIVCIAVILAGGIAVAFVKLRKKR